jgi:hypothetical protein
MLNPLIDQVPPQYTLPVQFDVGTDRKEILDNPLFMNGDIQDFEV